MYTEIGWEDRPSIQTPINAQNLGLMDTGIKEAHLGINNLRGRVDGRHIRTLSSTMMDDLVLSMNKALKYCLTVWYPATFPGTTPITAATLGGDTEHFVRPPAVVGFAIAAALKTGTYDSTVTGVTDADAKAAAVRLLQGVAAAHRSTIGEPSGWGNLWQSQMWAYVAAEGAWMIWADIDATSQTRVHNMLTGEAGLFRTVMQPLYWMRYDDTEMYAGDTKAEENAWIGHSEIVVQIIKPADAAVAAYTSAGHRYFMSASSMPQDILTPTTLHGVSLPDKFDGWNLRADGLVINHSRIHPDYMCSIAELQWQAGVWLAHYNVRIPGSSVMNAEYIYRGLTDVIIDDRTLYTPGTHDVYYPDGNDYGTDRLADKVMTDITAHCLGVDSLSSIPAEEWAELHLARQLALQARSTDGRTYLSVTEDNYPNAETWVARNLALAVLAATMPTTARYGYPTVSGV